MTYIKNTKNTEIHSKPHYIITLSALIFNLIMLIFPTETFNGAKNGLLLWFNKAIPSLLPFIIITNIMCMSGFADILKRPLTPLTQLIFGMNGNCILPIVTGFVSGCPLGAKTTCDLFTQGKISQNEAQRLLCFTNNSSPLFIVGTVGVGMLGSASDGYKIMLLHYLTAILTGVFLHIIICKKTQLPKSPKTKAENIYQKNIKSKNIISENIINQSIWNSMETILKIGGCIILFCVISSLINSLLPIMFNSERLPLIQGIVSSFLEVTNGCHALSSQKNATLCCACAIAWGGISIHTQTADFVHNAGLKMTPYIISKAMQTLLMLILGLIFL